MRLSVLIRLACGNLAVAVLSIIWPCASRETPRFAGPQAPAKDSARGSEVKPEDNPVAAALAAQFLKSVPVEGWHLIGLMREVADGAEMFVAGSDRLEHTTRKDSQRPRLSAGIADTLHSFRRSLKLKEDSAFALIAVTMDLSGQVFRKEDERMAKYTEDVGTVPIRNKELKGPSAEGGTTRTAQRTFIVRDRLELLQSHKGFHGQVTFVFSAYVDGEWKILQTKVSFASASLKGSWRIVSQDRK